MADVRPRISVVIRSHNDRDFIGKTLDMLTRQTVPDVELLSLDDSSTDGTAEIIASFPQVKRITGAPVPYVPGKVLNFAVKHASGGIVVFNNSDAIPQSLDYLERLTAPLADPGVGAVYGQQICRPEAQALVRKDYERAFGDGRIAATWRHFFSLASSAIRLQTLQENPFNENLYCSEDIDLTYRLRKQGLRIVYEPSAVTEHSHNYNLAGMSRRYYMEGLDHPYIYGDSISFATFLRRFAAEVMRDYVYLFRHRHFSALFSSPVYRFIQRWNYYRGCRESLRKIREAQKS